MAVIQVNRYADLAAAKQAAVARINAACEQALSSISAQYPQAEIDSWAQQEREADAWTADNTAATPLLDAIAAARGAAKTEVVAKVHANAAAFKIMAGAAFGKRQGLRDQIDAATTVREVVAINW